jgi:uncharacterized membrane protein
MSNQWLLFTISVLTGVFAQISLKRGLMGIVFDMERLVPSTISAVTNPFIIGWGLLGVASALSWVMLISKSELSVMFPMAQSLSYVLILILAASFFNEALTNTRVLGIAIICIGIFLLAN